MPRLGPVLVLIVLAATAHIAVAQSKNPGLGGVKGVQLVVEELGEQAKDCGVTVDALDAAMRIPISNSRLQFAETSLAPYLYVNVMALRPGTCFVAVQLSLHRAVWLEPRANSTVAYASVWDTASVLSGPAAGMGGRVTQAVEGHTKEFLGAWLRENSSNR